MLFASLHADMIEELISRGQQVDAVHFTQEVGLVDRFPPVPLLKAFLKDAKKAATSIMEDPNNSGRAAVFNIIFFISKHLYIYSSLFSALRQFRPFTYEWIESGCVLSRMGLTI